MITGSEKAFAAGADIKEMQDLTLPRRPISTISSPPGTGSQAGEADQSRRCRASRWAVAANSP